MTFDVVRGVAVIAVVVEHAAHWPSTATPLTDGLWNGVKLLGRCSLPLFVMLSGMLMARGGAIGSLRRFVIRRGRRTLLPWLAWAPVYFVTGYFLTNDVSHDRGGVADWWSGGGGHLYYLLLAPQLYLIFLAVRGAAGRARAVMAMVAAGQVALCVWRLRGPVDGTLLRSLVEWHGFELVPFWGGYLVAGILLGARISTMGREWSWPRACWASLGLLATAVLLLRVDETSPAYAGFGTGTGAFLRPLVIPFALAVLFWTAAVVAPMVPRSPRSLAAVDALSRHALGIYIVQSLVIYVPGRVLFPLLQGPLVTAVPAYGLEVVATLAGSVLLSAAIVRSPLALSIGEARVRRIPTTTTAGPRR